MSIQRRPLLNTLPARKKLPKEVEEAAKELVRRKRARHQFIDFVRYVRPSFVVSKHHLLMCDYLQQVFAGKIKRLIIEAPPRHSKSDCASRLFPAFWLGNKPTDHIIGAAYNADFATDEFGRKVRNLLLEDAYQTLFPETTLSGDSKAANRWNTAQGGHYYATGVGASVTGRGGHLIVIDDPLKGQEEASNKATRDNLWKWYLDDLYTRQFPEAAIVLIATRWNLDDLTGRLLEAQRTGGDKWKRLRLPALAEEKDILGREVGQALWEDWFPLPALEALRANMSPRSWSALYQQNPLADEGVYFKEDWLIDFDLHNFLSTHIYTHAEGKLRIYGTSDYAVSGEGGDYTVHLIIGVDAYDNLYVLDMWRQQATSDVWVESCIDLMGKWKVHEWLEESGQIEKGIGPFLSKRMHERRIYCLRTQKFSSRDKEQRARSIQGRASMGKLFVPHRAPWYSDFLIECTRFPVYKTDDIVDALSLIGRVLDDVRPGQAPKQEEPTGLRPTTAGEFRKYNRMLRKYGGRRQAIVV